MRNATKLVRRRWAVVVDEIDLLGLERSVKTLERTQLLHRVVLNVHMRESQRDAEFAKFPTLVQHTKLDCFDWALRSFYSRQFELKANGKKGGR